MTAAAPEVRADQHGTLTGYHKGCRCSSCKAAQADYMASYKQPKARDDQHGTLTGYKYGCRCISCREAMSEHNAEYRNRRAQVGPAQRPTAPVSHSRPRIGLQEDGRYSADCSCGWWVADRSRRYVEREVIRHARAAAPSQT